MLPSCDESLIFASMGKKASTFDYRILAGYLLPKDMLDFFDVTDVEEKHTGKILETGDEEVILHIHLDERDLRGEDRHDLKSNGFTESRQVSDFPIRDRKVVLHVRRRRWIDSNGRNIVLKNYDLLAEGVSYSKEFADALKKIFGYLPSNGPLAGATLQD